MGKYFGTDGVRGVAGKELTCELAYRLGRAGGKVLSSHISHKPKVIIAKDTRESCDMLEASIVAGLLSIGCDVYRILVAPTPAVAYLVRNYNFDLGVMISASHNPYEYNGIKFFNHQGYKLSDEIELEIEELLDSNQKLSSSNSEFGRLYEDTQLRDKYVEYLITTLDQDISQFKIAVDCANGATYSAAQKLFSDIGIDAEFIGISPNGTNINDGCGSTHLDLLKEKVKSGKFDLGIAFDGDGDRLLVVDENAEECDGDQVMSIISFDLINSDPTFDKSIVCTVMSNLGIEKALDLKGISMHRTKVGDRYVLEYMLKNNHTIGGEQSGHVIFLKHGTTGDGMLTAIQLLNSLKRLGNPISNYLKELKKMPQTLHNMKLEPDEKEKFKAIKDIDKYVSEIENRYNGDYRIVLRLSGTEPILRIMVEGIEQETIDLIIDEIRQYIQENIA